MTIDEAIERLHQLRDEAGGDAQLCRQVESLPSGRADVFEPAFLELCPAVVVQDGKRTHYICLRNGNTTQIVTGF